MRPHHNPISRSWWPSWVTLGEPKIGIERTSSRVARPRKVDVACSLPIAIRSEHGYPLARDSHFFTQLSNES